jgi:hypothetical protein
VAVCVVAILAIYLWAKAPKKEVQEGILPEVAVIPQVETIEKPQRAVTTEPLPGKPAEEPARVTEVIILDEPTEVEAEEVVGEPLEELVTIQGPITSMDPCLQTVTVEGTTVDVSSHGNFPMYRTYQIGDFVEVTYIERDMRHGGNVLHSIEILQER